MGHLSEVANEMNGKVHRYTLQSAFVIVRMWFKGRLTLACIDIDLLIGFF